MSDSLAAEKSIREGSENGAKFQMFTFWSFLSII